MIANLLTLVGDLARDWSAASGIPCHYAGLVPVQTGGIYLVLDAPTLDYTDAPRCDAGPASVTLTAWLTAASVSELAVSELYAQIIPVIASLPAGWTVAEVSPGRWPTSDNGTPAYGISITY